MSIRLALRRRPSIGSGALTMAVVVPLAIAAAWGAIALEGTKLGLVLAMLAVLGPIAAYAGLTWPLVFPFCFYVVLVPFDNILVLSTFGALTKLLAALSAGAIVLWLVRGKRYVVPDKAILAWGAFILLAIVSLIWAIDPVFALEEQGSLVELFLLYAVLAFMPTDMRTLRFVVGSVLIGGVIASLYGMYLFHNGIDVSTNGRLFLGTMTEFADRGEGRYIDPNAFSAALLVPFAIALMGAVEARRIHVRIVSLMCLVTFAGGIALAGSRGAMLSIAAMLVYLLIRSRKRLVIAGVALASLGVALGVYSNVLQRFSGIMESDGAGRLEIWRVGWAAFRSSPIIGQGFGDFPLAYNRAFMMVSMVHDANWNRAPHSNLVWIAVDLGAVGLALFLYAWFRQILTMRGIEEHHSLHSLRVALEAAMVGLFVASIFLGTLVFKFLWLAFALIMLTRNAWVHDTKLRARRSSP
jgi:hypothetical protein